MLMTYRIYTTTALPATGWLATGTVGAVEYVEVSATRAPVRDQMIVFLNGNREEIAAIPIGSVIAMVKMP